MAAWLAINRTLLYCSCSVLCADSDPEPIALAAYLWVGGVGAAHHVVAGFQGKGEVAQNGVILK